ncbi:toxin glutamine deamidase domain-containing protein [Nocardia cyriacigeorgica]|uniref:toxin glutamine deamidase domain-containing protein n=1 Tax=Nocardia cyriacigeorgica TaxID=135487 RepID=UPI002458355A|nr:toxin glutamine deamidase domain-containing protein [Nocardia cyriacigeorgica]
MAIDFPTVLGWVAGTDWPDGNEDDMRSLADDWRAAAAAIQEVIADVRAAKTVSLNAYPDGEAPKDIAKAFDSMLYATEGQDKGSLEQLIEGLNSMGESADNMANEIEYAKLMVISSLVLLAAELAAAWIFPPTAPAVQAAAIALTRIAIRIIGQTAARAIRTMVLSLARKKFFQFMVRHVAIDTVIGTGQDLGIQAYQVWQGNRKGIDWEQVAVTAVSSAVGGAVAGPLAHRMGNWLGPQRLPDGTIVRPQRVNPIVNGLISGSTAGLAGATAGYAASLGTQFGIDWAQDGWDDATKNLGNALNNFDPRAITAGVFNGAASGANKAWANQVWSNRRPDLFNQPSFQSRVDAVIFGPGGAPGSGAGGPGTPGGTPGGQPGAGGGGQPGAGGGNQGANQGGSGANQGGTGANQGGNNGAGQGGNNNGGQSGNQGDGGRTSPAQGDGGRVDDGSAPPPSQGEQRGDSGGDTRSGEGGRDEGRAGDSRAGDAADRGDSDSRAGDSSRAGDASRGDSGGDAGDRGDSRAGAATGGDGVRGDGGLQAESRADSGIGAHHGMPGAPTNLGHAAGMDGVGEAGEAGPGVPVAPPPPVAAGAPPAGAPPANAANASPTASSGDARAGAGASSPARGGDGRLPVGDTPSGGGPDRANDTAGPLTPDDESSEPRAGAPDGAAPVADSRASLPDTNRATPNLGDHQPGIQAGSRPGDDLPGLADPDRAGRAPGDLAVYIRGDEELGGADPARGDDAPVGGDRGRGDDVLGGADRGRGDDTSAGGDRGRGDGELGGADRERGDDVLGGGDRGRGGDEPAGGDRGRGDDQPDSSDAGDDAAVGRDDRPGTDRDAERSAQDGQGPRDRRPGADRGASPARDDADSSQSEGVVPQRRQDPDADDLDGSALPPAMFVIPPPDLSAGGVSGRDNGPGINRIGSREPAPVADSSDTPSPTRSDATRDGAAARRGRCAELALRLLSELTGSRAITPPVHPVGPEGMSAGEVEAAAGGRLRPFDGHQDIADQLLVLGPGSAALVVDDYTGPTNRYRVGAHAYALVNENGTIVVRDPGAGRVEGFPPTLPRDVRGIYGVVYDAQGNPLHPLGETVPAAGGLDADRRVGAGDGNQAPPLRAVPEGMYRGSDGNWHHTDDPPNTWRDKNFQLRDAQRWIPDPRTSYGYLHQAQPGPATPYQVTDTAIADRLAQASADRIALQAERDTLGSLVKQHMAEFGITDIHDLAPKKLEAEIQRHINRIAGDRDIPEPERIAQLIRLGELRAEAERYNDLGQDMVATSKLLGELGATAFVLDPALRPGAVQLTPFPGAFDGANTVDIAALQPGTGGKPPKLVVVEAKGVGSTLGGSKTVSAQQGSPEYLRRTLAIDTNLATLLRASPEQLRALDSDPAGNALIDARKALLRAHRDGTLEIEYYLAHTSEHGEVTIRRFDLNRDGQPVPMDIIGGVEASRLAPDDSAEVLGGDARIGDRPDDGDFADDLRDGADDQRDGADHLRDATDDLRDPADDVHDRADGVRDAAGERAPEDPTSDSRRLREDLRQQTPDDNRTTPVRRPEFGPNGLPGDRTTPVFDVARFHNDGSPVTVATVRVHVDTDGTLDADGIRAVTDHMQRTVDDLLNNGSRLRTGDTLLVDIVATADADAAHIRVRAGAEPGTGIRSADDDPAVFVNDLRRHLGLGPLNPNLGTGLGFSDADLSQLSNDIAAANTPARFDGMPATRQIAPNYLDVLEDPVHQARVQDALRDGDRFSIGADPRSNDYGRLINDGGPAVLGRSTNCVDCVLAALASFFGDPQVAFPRWLSESFAAAPITDLGGEPDGDRRIAEWLGREWRQSSNVPIPVQFHGLHRYIDTLGPGSAAVVANYWHATDPDTGQKLFTDDGRPVYDNGHATLVVYPLGADGPVWWDPQHGRTSDTPPSLLVDNSAAMLYIDLPADFAAPADQSQPKQEHEDGSTPDQAPSGKLSGGDLPGQAVPDPSRQARVGVPADSALGAGDRPGELRGELPDGRGDRASEPAAGGDRADVRPGDRDRAADPGPADPSDPVAGDDAADPRGPQRDRVPGAGAVDGRSDAGTPADDRQADVAQPDGRAGDPSGVRAGEGVGDGAPEPGGDLAGAGDLRAVTDPGSADPYDLVRDGAGQPDGWLIHPADPAQAEVRQLLARTESGRAALATLRAADVMIRFEEPGPGPALPDAFDGRTMEVFVGTRERDLVAQAAALVRAAVLTDAVVAGRVETIPARIRGLDRAEHIDAHRRAEADAIARTAEFRDELRRAGYEPDAAPIRDAVAAAVRADLESAYLDAYADALRQGVSPEAAREAGLAHLLTHPMFDSVDADSGPTKTAGAQWDAEQRPRSPEGMDEYVPSSPEAARAVAALLRDESAATREVMRIEADWDRVVDRLLAAAGRSGDELPNTRPEILEEFTRHPELGETDDVGVLAELTEQHIRAAADRARLVDEIADFVRRDLTGTDGPRAPLRVDRDPTGVLHVQRGDAPVRPDESSPPRSAESDAVVVRGEGDPGGAVVRGEGEREAAVVRVDAELDSAPGDSLSDRAAAQLRDLTFNPRNSDLVKWAAHTLDRLGVDVRFSTEPDARLGRQPNGRLDLGPIAGYDAATNTVVLHRSADPAELTRELVRGARLTELFAADAGEPLPQLTLGRDEYVKLMLDRAAEALALSFRADADSLGKFDLKRPGVTALERAFVAAYQDAVKQAEKAYWKSGVVRSYPAYHRAAFRAGVRAVRTQLDTLGPLVDGVRHSDHFGAIWDRAHGIDPGSAPESAPRPAKSDRDHARLADQLAAEIESLRMVRELGTYVPVGPAEDVYTRAYDKAYAKAERALRRDPDGPPPEQAAQRAGRDALKSYLDRTGTGKAETLLDVIRSMGDLDGPGWGFPTKPATDSTSLDTPVDAADATADRTGDPELVRRVLDLEYNEQPHPQRLTDSVARYPATPENTTPRLVVVAEPGGHVDALRELATRYPEYTDVLWDLTHTLEYKRAVRGPDGEPVGKPVNAYTAEGPYRRPHGYEARDEILAHYLRLRQDNRTALGLGEWLAQLGQENFKPRPKNRPGGRGPTLLREGVGERPFRGGEVDPTHPGDVVNRLARREIPMPTERRPGAPVHYSLQVFDIGAMPASINLAPDGRGGWRVAPPLDGSSGQALNRLFEGLADSDRERLVARIVKVLEDGSADLYDRSPPRSRFGTFIDGLPFRSGRDGDSNTDRLGDPVPESGDRSESAEPAPGAQEDRAPVVDEWTPLTPAEVGDRLASELRSILDNPDLEVVGFDRTGTDPEFAREYARAIVDLATRYPQVELRRIGIEDMAAGLVGMTRAAEDRGTGGLVTDSMTLNTRFASDPSLLRQWMVDGVAAGRFHPSVLSRPVYAAVAHEFGHALDYAGNRAARVMLDDTLIEYYVMNRLGTGTVEGYDNWLHDQLTGYGFDAAGQLDPGEALAEAFVDVVLNGRDNVDDAVGQAYDLLVGAAERTTGVDVRPGRDDQGTADRLGDRDAESGAADRESDRMAHDGIQPLRPPGEDDTPYTQDAELLGIVDDDEWSDLDPQQVGERLRDHLREVTGNPEFDIFGFDLPGLNAVVVRDYARGLVDMFARFPQVDVRSVGIARLGIGVLGETEGIRDRGTDPWHVTSITLSYDDACSAHAFLDATRNGVDNGQFTSTMLRRPVYYVAVHEFGHALDYAGNLVARDTAESELLARAKADPDGDFGEWLRQLSGYSLDADGMLRPGEALAEALAEYLVGGAGEANTPVRILYELLVDAARDPAPADTPAPSTPDRMAVDGDPAEPDKSAGRDSDEAGAQADSAEGPITPDSVEPPPKVTIEVEGQQVEVPVREDGPDRWRVVPEPDEPEAADTRSPLRREWDAVREMMPGREPQPKYPSGSPVGDSAGQAALRDGVAGIPDLVGPPPPAPPPAPPSDVPRIEAPPDAGQPDPTLLRIAQQAPIWIQNREMIPILGELSGRMRGTAGEHLPMRTADGEEYRPWNSDADPDLVREQIVSDHDIQRITPEDARQALLDAFPGADTEQRQRIIDALLERDLVTAEEADRLADEPPAGTRPPEPAGPPPEGESLADAAQRLLGVDLPDESLQTLRELIDEHQYRVVRAAAAIEGLAAAAQRFHEEQTLPFTHADWDGTRPPEIGPDRAGLDRGRGPDRLDGPDRDADDELIDDAPRPNRFAEPDPAGRAVPFGDWVSFLDQNPMGRFRNEIIAAFGHHLGLLDTVPIGNGADPLPEWGEGDELGRDQGLRQFFEHALRRDQLRDELATWAAMRDLDVRQLTRDMIDSIVTELRDANVARSDRVAEFAEIARQRYPDTGDGDLVGEAIGDQVVRIPEPDGPDRLIVVDGARGRHQALADALASDPQLVRDLGDGRLTVDYRVAHTDWAGRTHLDPVDTPQVLHRQETVDGRELSVTLIREGDGPWRPIPVSDPASATDPATTAPRPREEILADLIRVMHELGLGPADVHPDMIDQTVADQLLDNAVRAAQIEGLTDFTRSANDIQTFHEVGDARSRLATRLGIPQIELTGETMGDALSDTSQRRGLRAQQVTDLAGYARQLREIDPAAVDAARNRLAERLVSDSVARALTKAKFAERAGVSLKHAALMPPGRVDVPGQGRKFAVDPTGMSPAKLTTVIRDLEARGQGELVREALTEYANALLELDPYAAVARGDHSRDPRVIDGRYPMHDRDSMTALRDIIADAVRARGADDFARAVADAARRSDTGPLPSDDPTRRPTPNRDWARIVGGGPGRGARAPRPEGDAGEPGGAE